MSVKLRLIQALVLAGISLIALSSTALAATTYHVNLAGVETGIPVKDGCGSEIDLSSFLGRSSGDVNGAFTAAICHTALAPSAEIKPGGLFTLSGRSTDGQTIVPVTGQFTGGTVLFVTADHFGTFCYQLFFVHGTVGPLGTATTPTGDFRAWLTHYGAWNGNSCNVTFATVAGRATITA